MKSFFYLSLICVSLGCTAPKNSKQASPKLSPYAAYIQEVKQQYAPDARTVLFSVGEEGIVLKGETTSPAAKAALVKELHQKNIAFVDSIAVLPAANLEGKLHAVVTLSVANLRTAPRHPAELATQATLGTPLKVFKKGGGWYYVQTPDHYLAWVDGAGIQLMDEKAFANWQKSEKLLYTNPFGFAYATPDVGGVTLSDLVFGDVMEVVKKVNAFYEVRFPDGRTAFVPVAEAAPYKDWASSRQPTAENLVQTARKMLGVPYLWGGTSFKGVDCSGFTKTVYFMNGLVLPRDASQQIHIGEPVDTKNNWENLRPGDLLFFGVPAQEGNKERVVHVGMWIGGNQEFIHAAGLVRISSFNPQAPNFDTAELKRFLRAKRITPAASLYDLRTTNLF